MPQSDFDPFSHYQEIKGIFPFCYEIPLYCLLSAFSQLLHVIFCNISLWAVKCSDVQFLKLAYIMALMVYKCSERNTFSLRRKIQVKMYRRDHS